MEALHALIADDVVWHVPGRNSLASEVRGWDALVDWFERLRTAMDGTFHLVEHDVLGNDRHVVALSVMSARKGGALITVNVVSVFHFREGRQQERWFLPADLEAWDRMFG